MRVCVSDEVFGKASDETVARIVAGLGGENAHIVAIARQYDSYLPSQWQQRVKAGRLESYEEWLRIVLGNETSLWEHRNVWGSHDTKALVDRWVEHVGPDRFTLVVAEESDRGQLSRLFEAMLGLPGGLLQLHADRSNQSSALAEVELIRSLNNALANQGWSKSAYQRLVKRGVRAMVANSGATPGPRRPAMPAWAGQMVRELSDMRIAQINALGVRVLGDPERLRGQPIERDDAVSADLEIPAHLAGHVAGLVIEAALEELGIHPSDLEQQRKSRTN